ncbi:hypothetical protein NQ314_006922 [Rhamnusium bicolor]|uniref:Retrotransposon gag domain-containing protein n=1 Tax=Rhamnusium bicolor TaxID=1586634 RepID=A0AAV8YWU3_9CUCU|nr:hypothetical protein NQ314_006922 [Rhamnusium bicolor]
MNVAILLNSIGSITYKLLRDFSFPQKIKEKTFQQLCELLSSQFKSQVSAWRERRKFYALRQAEDEQVSEWYVRIRSAAVTYNFGTELMKILAYGLSVLTNGKIVDH